MAKVEILKGVIDIYFDNAKEHAKALKLSAYLCNKVGASITDATFDGILQLTFNSTIFTDKAVKMHFLRFKRESKQTNSGL